MRREVLRIERGEAEEEIRADLEREAAEKAEAEVRERSIRLQEQRYSRTTHSAIVERLRERGIDLSDPSAPGEIIEN